MASNTSPTLLNQVIDYISALDLGRRAKLAKFCGVQLQTVNRWRRGASVPLGKSAIQLHYLLEFAGYTEHEWGETNDSVETVGRALAFGLITLDELTAHFNDACNSRLTQMMCGHKHISVANQKVFDDLAATHAWDIEAARGKCADLKIASEKDKLIVELSNKLEALLPLVKDMVSDNWTEADRYELRDRAGRRTVFDLYNALGELCGERARQMSLADRAKQAAAMLMPNHQQ
jgi:hypothetical protein